MTPSGRVNREHLSDETLIAQMREGDKEAYAELWKRHFRAGLRAARSFDHLEDPDDLVAEAFTRIFRALQEGTGPTVSFRPYLYTTIRNLALRRVPDLAAVQDIDLDTIVDPATEDLDDALDKSLTVNAFRSLPERWQAVLWYTEVERMTPAQTGTLLGLTANAASALAFRARSALRAAWLQAHVTDAKLDADCRSTLKHIGEYAQGTLSTREARRVRDHLDTCTRCSIIAGEVDHVAGRLAIIMLPLVLGGAAALAFGHALAAAAGTGAHVAAVSSVPAIPPVPNPGGAAAGAASTTAAAGSSATAFSTVALIAAAAVVVVGGGVAATVAMVNSSSSSSSTQQAGPPAADARPAPEPTTSSDPTPPETAPVVPDPTIPIAPVVKVTPPPAAPDGQPVLPVLDAPTIDATPTLIRLASTVFSGTGTPGAEIEVLGLVPSVSIPVAEDGTWQWKDSALVEGENTLSFVQQQDGYQDSAPVSIAITVDTVAPSAPIITSTWSDTQTTAPQFSGTAEPQATVTLSNQAGAVLETVTADAAGDWSSGVVPGLLPTDTALDVVQIDQAGNSSTAAVADFAFVPVITSPMDGATLPPSVVPIVITGWANAQVTVELDGATAGSFSLGPAGSITLHVSTSGGNLAPGTYSVTVLYGPAASTTVTFTIS